MRFWWFMLMSDLLVPVIMLVSGWIMWKHCPKNINIMLGYRTKRSMKNIDTWKFANDYCGKLWTKIGLIMIVITLLINIPFCKSSKDLIGTLGTILMFVQLAVLLLSIIPVEIVLKKNFNVDGSRK